MIEVLASTVVVLVMFIAIYSSLLPTMSSYEKRFNYEDVSTVYDMFYIKKIFLKDYDNIVNNIGDDNYVYLYKDGACYINDDYIELCNNTLLRLGVSEVLLFKSINSNSYSGDLNDYISYIKNKCDSNVIVLKMNDGNYSFDSFLNDSFAYEV